MNKRNFLKEKAAVQTKIDKKFCSIEKGVISKKFFCIFEHQPPKSVFVTYVLTYNKGNARLHSVRERY